MKYLGDFPPIAPKLKTLTPLIFLALTTKTYKFGKQRFICLDIILKLREIENYRH
ncbi:hypothetical protein RINTHM_390 [Richelia intracellularis HM01]|nr:hypothetical protein RINTHM_390 [Richelia intracellularis HM01]